MKKLVILSLAASITALTSSANAQVVNVYNNQAVPTSLETTYPYWAYAQYLGNVDFARTYNGDDYLNADLNQTQSRSPKNFQDRGSWGRFNLTRHRNAATNTYANYNDGVMVLAHRGLVDLKLGINENTLDAVQHAMNRGNHMIELDIQASSDGQPMVTHDDNLIRTTGIDANVNTRTKAQIQGLFTRIANPAVAGSRGTRANTTTRYCTSGNILMSLDWMYSILRNASTAATVTGGLGTCVQTADVDETFFLDPKNLASGQAAMKFMADATRSGSLRQRWYMKTYDDFWATNPNDAALLVKNSLPAGTSTAGLQVMPVISIRGYLDEATPNYTAAVNKAAGIVHAWTAQGFSVASVEFPGAWDAKWTEFVRQFYGYIKLNDYYYYGKNPAVYFQNYANEGIALSIPPVLAYGYRFPDFKIGAQAYTWSMQGYSQVDNSNATRRKLGGSYGTAGARCKAGLFFANTYNQGQLIQTGCFVTTDYPNWESNINYYNKVETYVGAPQTSFSAFP